MFSGKSIWNLKVGVREIANKCDGHRKKCVLEREGESENETESRIYPAKKQYIRFKLNHLRHLLKKVIDALLL